MLVAEETENPQIVIERLAQHRVTEQSVDEVLNTRIHRAANKGLLAQLFEILLKNTESKHL